MRLLPVALALASPLTIPAAAQCGVSHVDDFTFQNQGNWRWGGPLDQLVPTGGFPTDHRASFGIDTFAPILTSTGPSTFTGDYRAAGVTALGVDLQTFDLDFPSSCQRPLSLVLTQNNGTPGNPFDDVYVYTVLPQTVPCPDGLWHGYSVDVPSQSTTLPANWGVDPNWTGTADAAWNTVIADVSSVSWFYGDPTFFFILQMWDIGADNPRISFSGGATTYCDSQLNSAGCQPRISVTGVASASSPLPCLVDLADTVSQKSGLMFYGFARTQVPYLGGSLCVLPPTRRTPVQTAGGNASGTDCSGNFSFDLNALIQSGGDPLLVSGAGLCLQYWSRDPLHPSRTNLSNAVALSVCP